jgi:hypothetical protein
VCVYVSEKKSSNCYCSSLFIINIKEKDIYYFYCRMARRGIGIGGINQQLLEKV